MISILTITVHTNIPGSKIILYNPSMTMQQESPDSIIFFPETVKIEDRDLQANNRSEHDQIKVFLSPNELKTIIDKKQGNRGDTSGQSRPQNIRHNIGKIIGLLFSKDEVFYINGKPHSIFYREWAAKDQGNVTNVDTVYKINRPRSTATVITNPAEFQQGYTEVKLYNIRINLGLVEAEDKVDKTGYCALKEYRINELVDEIAQDLDKWLYDTIDDSEETVEKLYNTPKGFISLRDWRKVVAGDGKRDYFVNKITGRARFTSPFPVMALTNQIKPWDRNPNKDGIPPSAPQQSFTLVPQGQAPEDVPTALPIQASIPDSQAMPAPSAPPMEGGGSTSGKSGAKKHKKSHNKTRKVSRKGNNGNNGVNSKRQLNKTIKMDPIRVGKALSRSGRDSGNISVFLASQTPEKYFSDGQIKNLSG